MKEKWNRMPKWFRIVCYSILGVLGAAALGIFLGFIIMWLWNWLMPELFGLKEITYWQGVGLFFLAKILIGAIGGNDGDSKGRKEKKECRNHPRRDGERGAEFGAAEDYNEWWDKEGRRAFDDFVKNRYASEKENETESEREKKE